MKKIVTSIIIVIFIFVIALVVPSSYSYFSKNKNQVDEEKKTVVEIDESKEKEEAYNSCMLEPYKMDNLDEKFNEVLSKYSSSSVSIYMTEINNEYSYYLNENTIYYSASAAKIFMAIYIIEQVRAGNLDINSTYTLLPQDKREDSPYINAYALYSEIKIADLLTYFLTISDNSAYFLLIREIGEQTLNDYFLDKYNIELNFTYSNPFINNYSATVANQSLQILYNDLSVEDEYSTLVKNAMNNNNENTLNFDDTTFLHKYGEYNSFYHDIGIYDSENPYLISILTNLGYQENDSIVTNISREIYEIYEENLTAKENYCKIKSEF